jgi:hypothetical protein
MILLSSNIPCGLHPDGPLINSDHGFAAIYGDLDANDLPIVETGADGQDLGPLPAKGFLTVNDSHGGFLSLVLPAKCRGVQSEAQMPIDIIAGYLGISNNG